MKGIGKYSRLRTCLDEDPEKNVTSSGIYNFGFDNEQTDFLYEAKD